MSWTTPGALGGSAPEVYIGQVYGPFLLPCHKHVDFSDPQWKQKVMGTPQCAGAAMFRKAQGLDQYLPEAIHTLEPEGPVLSDPAAFYAHHKQITKAGAIEVLRHRPPHVLLAEQLSRQDNINHSPKPKDSSLKDS